MFYSEAFEKEEGGNKLQKNKGRETSRNGNNLKKKTELTVCEISNGEQYIALVSDVTHF